MPDRSSRRCALAIVVSLVATLLAPGGEVHASGGDLFASAEAIGVPAVVTGDTSAATLERHEPRPCGRIATTVWFKLQPATGTLTASTAGSAFDTVLALYRGSALAGFTSLDCNDDFGGTRQSQVQSTVIAGTSYYVQLGGFNAASGAFTLTTSFAAAAPPPPPSSGDPVLVGAGDIASCSSSGDEAT